MEKPNIILILTDHFRRDALGPATPNLNRLAQRGTRFAHAYSAAPLCQPARACLVTGMFPSQHGVCGNQSPPIAPALRQDTFMQRLQRAGYHTALIGKHHYIDSYGIGRDVTDDDDLIKGYGFDQVLQVCDDGENLHNDDEYTRHLAELGRLEEFRQAQRQRPDPYRHAFDDEDLCADGFIGGHGVRFLEEYQRDEPFYLNLSFIGPHPPFWHPGELGRGPEHAPPPVGAPDDPAVRLRRAHYVEKCALIDRYVGRLLAALESSGKLEDTAVVFTSDHGDCLGDFGIWDKRFFYESSAGVPLLMCGPGVPAQERSNGPRVSKALASHIDLFPTILGLAGLSVAPDRRRPGRDLAAVVRGDLAGADQVMAELATAVMVRTANWKLVFDPEAGGVQQLFNLVVDPTEETNLAGVAGYESVTLDLVQRLLASKIGRSQFTHVKEEQRLQRVHLGQTPGAAPADPERPS